MIARNKPPIQPRPERYHAHCDCVHHDALACIAEQHHTTRFNASLLFSTTGERNGRCICKCHIDAHGQPVSEQVWLTRGTTPSRINARVVSPHATETRGKWARHRKETHHA